MKRRVRSLIPERTPEGFPEEAAIECHLRRCQEFRKRALRLCAKHMGDGSEPSFRKPRVGATSVWSRSGFSGLCFLSQAGFSEGHSAEELAV